LKKSEFIRVVEDAAEMIASKDQEFICHALSLASRATYDDFDRLPIVKDFMSFFELYCSFKSKLHDEYDQSYESMKDISSMRLDGLAVYLVWSLENETYKEL
jgi:hypothetical protein